MPMRMSAEELQQVLLQNSSISISAASPSTILSVQSQGNAKIPKDSNKYYNVPVYVFSDGFVFFDEQNKIKKLEGEDLHKQHGKVERKYDSIKEYEREQELQLLEKKGLIQKLKRQFPLTIQEKCQYHGQTIRPIVYRADFCYIKNNVVVIEDVKGYDKKKGKWKTTPVFDLKWKLLKAKYPQYDFEIV